MTTDIVVAFLVVYFAVGVLPVAWCWWRASESREPFRSHWGLAAVIATGLFLFFQWPPSFHERARLLPPGWNPGPYDAARLVGAVGVVGAAATLLMASWTPAGVGRRRLVVLWAVAHTVTMLALAFAFVMAGQLNVMADASTNRIRSQAIDTAVLTRSAVVIAAATAAVVLAGLTLRHDGAARLARLIGWIGFVLLADVWCRL